MNIYLALFLATLSTILLPVPEEATLLGAGYAARFEHLSLPACVAVTWLAVMLGDVSSYAVGRFLLARLLTTRFAARIVPERRRLWATRLVERHGARAIVVARFLVGLRGFVYFAIGASRYPFVAFVLINAAAAAVEVGGLVALGFGLGNLHGHPRLGTAIDLVAAALLVAALFGPVLVRSVAGRVSNQ